MHHGALYPRTHSNPSHSPRSLLLLISFHINLISKIFVSDHAHCALYDLYSRSVPYTIYLPIFRFCVPSRFILIHLSSTLDSNALLHRPVPFYSNPIQFSSKSNPYHFHHLYLRSLLFCLDPQSLNLQYSNPIQSLDHCSGIFLHHFCPLILPLLLSSHFVSTFVLSFCLYFCSLILSLLLFSHCSEKEDWMHRLPSMISLFE